MDFLTYISHKIIKIIIPHISNKIKSIMTSLQYLQQTKKKTGKKKRLAPHEISTFNTRQTWLLKHSDHHILYIREILGNKL